MRFKSQSKALAEMELETRRAMRRLEDAHLSKVQTLWNETKDRLRGHILNEYLKDFPDGDWDLPGARVKGTLFRIERAITGELEWFKRLLTTYGKGAMMQVREHEVSRALWMLDQLTPPSYTPKTPRYYALESDAPMDDIPWYFKASEWLDVFGKALAANITLGAINASTHKDAADEVNATRVGTPAFDTWDVLDRLLTTEAIKQEADARDSVSRENADIVEREVWQTMEDANVCPICDANAGLTREEAEDDIPAHPWDRCFWRIVPKEWADMLRSGNPEDKELAYAMDDAGMVPDSMAIRAEDGSIAAVLTIDFDTWSKKQQPLTGSVAQ